MNPLLIIPIKGNSKRVKEKNLRLLHGIPLMFYSINAAIDSGFEYIVICTESNKVISMLVDVKRYNNILILKKPYYLSEDPSEIKDTCTFVLEKLKSIIPETFILIQPTNPFVEPDDIQKCYKLFLEHKRITVRSVVKVGKQVWRPIDKVGSEAKIITPYSTNSFIGNGSIVVMCVSRFLEINTLADIMTVPYIVSREKSIDIDEEIDFFIAEQIMKVYINNEKT